MSLPEVTPGQIEQMNIERARRMKQDGIEPIQEEQEEQYNVPVAEQYEQVEEEFAQEQEATEQPKEDNFNYNQRDNNFRVMRERAEKAEREKDEAIKFAMSLQNQQSRQSVQEYYEPEADEYADLNIENDSLVEGTHLRKVLNKVTELENKLKNYERQAKNFAEETFEVKLQTKLPDFTEVVTRENLSQLRSINPDLADAILQGKDQFKNHKLAYDMIKQLGIYKSNSYNQEKYMVQKNIAKPRPLSSIAPTQSDSPLSKVNAFANNPPLTKELKEKRYREMQEAIKNF